MKKIIAVLLLTIVSGSGTSLFSQAEVSVSPTPVTISVTGNTDASYGVTTWPIFGHSASNNEACANSVRAMSGKLKHTTHPRGGSYPEAEPQTIISKTIDIPALGLGNYKKSAAITVSWTVRIEAEKKVVEVWPELCSPWKGTMDETFPGGDVDTMLYVNDKKAGNTAIMTFPSLGSGQSTVSDPTLTNSVTLRAADFAKGELPDKIKLEIKWMNKTIGATIRLSLIHI